MRTWDRPRHASERGSRTLPQECPGTLQASASGSTAYPVYPLHDADGFRPRPILPLVIPPGFPLMMGDIVPPGKSRYGEMVSRRSLESYFLSSALLHSNS